MKGKSVFLCGFALFCNFHISTKLPLIASAFSLMFFLRNMRINIHSCGKISVAHHLLDKLDVVRAFTEPRAECVSHVMYAKMRQQFRLTIFQFSP